MAWGAPKPHQDQPPPPRQTLGRARRGSHSAPWAEAELGWSVTRLQPPRVTCAWDAGVRGDPQEDAALAGQADGLWSGRPRGGAGQKPLMTRCPEPLVAPSPAVWVTSAAVNMGRAGDTLSLDQRPGACGQQLVSPQGASALARW